MKNLYSPLRMAILILFIALCMPMGLQAQTTRYVKQTATGSGDGSSWANASSNLQAMINASAANDEVWVAAGTYLPTQDPFGSTTPTNPRDKTFYVNDGVKIYGGFNATTPEATLAARSITTNTTTLSGDFNANDVVTGSGSTLSITGNSENAYHVVLASAPNNGIGVTVDGFTIKGANANGANFSSITVNGNSIFRYEGGGINTYMGTNTLSNNTILENLARSGGGIYTIQSTNTLSNNVISGNSAGYGGGGLYAEESTNTLSNNTISGNLGTSLGGGIFTNESTNTLSNNTISGNSASNNGGGLYTYASSNTLSNNTISGNSVGIYGGGIYCNSGVHTLSNNTISGNSATDDGGGIYTSNCTSTLTNNIFWDNKKGTDATVPSADYYADGTNGNTFINNLLQLASSNYPVSASTPYAIGVGATGNIFAQDPLFVNAADIDGADNIHRTADDGLALLPNSPAINTGTTPNPTVPTDILGNIRSGNYDMGAYELVCTPPTTAITGATTGCDSIALTANGGTSYVWSGGTTPTTATNTFTASGIYTVTVTNAAGCTATASANVTINALPTPSITQTGAVLSTGTFTTYQWFLNGTAIVGANAQTYTPTANGTYTVAVTNASTCAGQSADFSMTNVGVDIINATGLSIYPNPTDGQVFLQGGMANTVEIFAVDGRLVQSESNVTSFNIAHLDAGMYMVRISTAQGTGTTRLFKVK